MTIPSEARRLFAHYDAAALDGPEAGVFVALRLAEEGDRRDLRRLVERRGEGELRRAVEGHGARQLSRRSLAFWRRVLDLPALEPEDGAAKIAEALWPR